MSNTTDQSLGDVLAFLVTSAVIALAIALLVRVLGRRRPELRIGMPIAVGLIVRVLMAAAVSLTSYGSTLRGGDELAFLFGAGNVTDTPFLSTAWVHSLTNEFHIFIIAVQQEVLGSSDLALRVTEAGIAVAGLALLATAVYELAGPRAAVLAAWLLALEPSSVFFSTLIHKESLVMLAVGLVALGGAKMWKRADLLSLVPMAAGVALAASVRGYVSWFLLIASAAITLHAGVRGISERTARSLVAVSAVVILAAITIPAVTGGFADQNLEKLDISQRANAQDQANLQLEAVDFSSGSGIVTNLPTRVGEVIFRPYPWELDNVSQQLGLMGTLVVLISLYLLIRELIRNHGRIIATTGPLLYLSLCLLVAYALAAGNAGTAFRYRVQVVALVLCMISALALRQSYTSSSRSRTAVVGTGGRSLPFPTR